MKKSHIPALALGFLGVCATFTACDDDKQLTLGAPETKLLQEITFDVSPVLPLAVGADSTLVYSYGPEDVDDATIVFSSSDESVASVDQNGKITAHKIGQATITARPGCGFKVYDAEASVSVNVIEKVIYAEQINVSLLTDVVDGIIYETDEIQLAAEILPADHTYSNISWHSADESIATVDQDGTVKCLKAGEAEIYVLAHDHGTARGSYKFTIEPYIAAQEVALTPFDAPLCISRGSVRLNYAFTPSNATLGSVEWESSAPEVATVYRGVVTPTGFGEATIMATCPATGYQAQVTVSVEPGWWIWDAENLWNGWMVSNYSSHVDSDVRGEDVWRLNFKNPGAGKKWRGDIKVDCSAANPFIMRLKSYPVIAVRMTTLKGCNHTLDCVASEGNGGNPKVTSGYDLGDGTQLIIYNVGSRPNYKDKDEVKFTVFQIKVADIPYDNIDESAAYYDIHWIRTFASEDEAKAFGDADVAGK